MRRAIRMIRPLSSLAACLVAGALLASPVAAAVPGVINYQGHLTDNTPQQNPVNGTLSMDFSIWDAQVGGASLWTETQSVQVVNGLFDVRLGEATPIPPSIFDGAGDRYLEIHVASETLAPRQRIGATPYAARAADASSLAGTPAASFQLRIANPCPPGLAINSVAANGSVSCVAVGSTGCCQMGTADCNANPNDGCERNVATDPNNCGACGLRCSNLHVPTPTCSGACNGTCAAGYADCNANKLFDGCEVYLQNDRNNCGACGTICSTNHSTGTCVTGLCTGACNVGWADCNDYQQNDGCETSVSADVNNCGACGHVCDPGTVCDNGRCGIVFSDSFVFGTASPAQCTHWQSFATQLDAGATYTAVSMYSSINAAGVTCTGAPANQLCQALRTGTAVGPVTCGGHSWLVGVGCFVQGSVALMVDSAACSCSGAYTVRPCVESGNWGGITNGTTCSAPSQTMTVSCSK